jgi:signal transduction histidine kinase
LNDKPIDCLADGGEMGALMRSVDWTRTPLDPVESWPPALRFSVSLILNSSFPTAVGWGPDLYLLYNDAYRPVLGDKHPWSLGKPCRECWSELWDVVGPLLLQSLNGGPATWLDAFLLEMNRHGYLEETYFVASYSPIADGARTGGVMATCYEVTDQVISERRLRTLSNLAVQLNRENNADQICEIAAGILGDNALDVTFALLYLFEENRSVARLKAAVGMKDYDGATIPEAVDLNSSSANVWRFDEVSDSGQSLALNDLDRRFGPMPGAKWPASTQSALVIPLGPTSSADHYGFLIAGISPRLFLDDRYRGFLELVADQIATALRRARAHEEERRRVELMARADREKDEFLAMLGHELRNPLSPILTVLQLMNLRGEKALSSERATIERHVQHVERLVDDLLDVSKLTRGKIPLEREVIDLAEVISRAIEMSSPLIEERFHELFVTAPQGTVFVDGDPLRLSQVVANLLTNAAKYTEPQGRIWVQCYQEGHQAVLSVRDNGKGIEPEFAARVFELFSQNPAESAAKRTGLGLGLAIVKSLVSLHGGSISVESPGAGMGSEFTIRLPASDLNRLPPEPPADPPGPPILQAGSRRIMIVDDNEDAAEILAETLKFVGHDTQIAHDAPSALKLVSRFAPDVILMDIGLPGMDGYELARVIRSMADLNSPRLIALTGYGQESDRRRAAEAGFDLHLVKPVDIDRLLAVIDEKAS